MKYPKKRIVALGLILSMLLALGISVYADDTVDPAPPSSSENPDSQVPDEDQEIKLNVTYHGSNYEEWSGSELEDIFSGEGLYTVQSVSGKPAYVIGKLSEPSVISTVTVTYGDTTFANRARVSRVYASVDGTQWDELGMLPETLEGNQTYRVEASSPVRYEYIKVEQSPSLAQYFYTLGGISVYSMQYADGSNLCTVTFESYVGGNYNDGSANAEHVFTPGNANIWNSADCQGVGSVYVVGSFAVDTQITRVRLVTHPTLFARLKNATVEASVDGTEWEVIATVPDTLTGDTVTLTVDNEETFRYIRVCNGLSSGLFSLKTVAVWGKEAVVDTKPGADLKGLQFTPVSDGTYAVRFVSTIDSVDYSAVGYEITSVALNDGWHLSGREVCTSLKGRDENGNVVTAVVAATYGKPFLFTGIIENIPAGQEVDFTVIPYATQKDGTVLTGDGYIIHISADGVMTSDKL